MPQLVNVVGVGDIEFPDGMHPDEIQSVLQKNFPTTKTATAPAISATDALQVNPQQPPTSPESLGAANVLGQQQAEQSMFEQSGLSREDFNAAKSGYKEASQYSNQFKQRPISDEEKLFRSNNAQIIGKTFAGTGQDISQKLIDEPFAALYGRESLNEQKEAQRHNKRAMMGEQGFEHIETPYERAVAELHPALRVATLPGKIITETSPQLALTVANPVAGALAQGFLPSGFDPQTAVLNLVAPFLGRGIGSGLEKIAEKAGVEKELVLAAINKLGGASVVAGSISAPAAYEVSQMPEGEEKEKAKQELIENGIALAAMSVVGGRFMSDKEAANPSRQIGELIKEVVDMSKVDGLQGRADPRMGAIDATTGIAPGAVGQNLRTVKRELRPPEQALGVKLPPSKSNPAGVKKLPTRYTDARPEDSMAWLKSFKDPADFKLSTTINSAKVEKDEDGNHSVLFDDASGKKTRVVYSTLSEFLATPEGRKKRYEFYRNQGKDGEPLYIMDWSGHLSKPDADGNSTIYLNEKQGTRNATFTHELVHLMRRLKLIDDAQMENVLSKYATEKIRRDITDSGIYKKDEIPEETLARVLEDWHKTGKEIPFEVKGWFDTVENFGQGLREFGESAIKMSAGKAKSELQELVEMPPEKFRAWFKSANYAPDSAAKIVSGADISELPALEKMRDDLRAQVKTALDSIEVLDSEVGITLFAKAQEMQAKAQTMNELAIALKEKAGLVPPGKFSISKLDKESSKPAFYSRLTRTIEESKQGKATGAQWKATIQNSKLGANKDEFELVGVGDLENGKTYTKQEVLDYLKANEVVVKDVTLGGVTLPDRMTILAEERHGKPYGDLTLPQQRAIREELEGQGESTHFSTYQLPGAKEGSYREVLLTVPSKPQPADIQYVAGHEKPWRIYARGEKVHASSYKTEAEARASLERFPEFSGVNWRDGHHQYSSIANPLVRLRFNERTTADGKRMLFLEEIQAPQKGQFEKMPALFQKNWREIAFKFALRHASENGFDALGWATGKHQAERYDLSKQVSEVQYNPKTQELVAYDHSRDANEIINKKVEPDKIQDYIGKDAAKKLLESPVETPDGFNAPVHSLQSGDLKVGGAGLAKLYDVDFRNVVNNLPAVKKAGQKVGSEEIVAGMQQKFVGEIPLSEIERELSAIRNEWDGDGRTAAGWQRWNVGLDGQADAVVKAMRVGNTYKEAMEKHGSSGLASALGGKFYPVPNGEKIHSLDLTPTIRESVMGGQALFSVNRKKKFYEGKLFKDVAHEVTAEAAPKPVLAPNDFRSARDYLVGLITGTPKIKAHGVTINLANQDPNTARKIGLDSENLLARAIHAISDGDRRTANPNKVMLAPMTEHTIRQADFILKMERDEFGEGGGAHHFGTGYAKLYNVGGEQRWHLVETDSGNNFITQYSWPKSEVESGRVMRSRVKDIGQRVNPSGQQNVGAAYPVIPSAVEPPGEMRDSGVSPSGSPATTLNELRSPTAIPTDSGKVSTLPTAGQQPLSEVALTKHSIGRNLGNAAAHAGLELEGARRGLVWRYRNGRQIDELARTKDAANNAGSRYANEVGNDLQNMLLRALGMEVRPTTRLRLPNNVWGFINPNNDPIRLPKAALTFVRESGINKAELVDYQSRLEKALANPPTSVDGKLELMAWRAETFDAIEAIKYGIKNFDKLAPVAVEYGKQTKAQWDKENAAGMEVPYHENYVLHAQDVDGKFDLGAWNGGSRGTENTKFKKERDFATLVDSMEAGIRPKSMDALGLLRQRVNLGERMLNNRTWVDAMATMVDAVGDPLAKPLITNRTEKPVTQWSRTPYPGGVRVTPISDPGYHIEYKWVGTKKVPMQVKVSREAPKGYDQANFAGQDFAVKKGFSNYFDALTEPSVFSKNAVGRAAMSGLQFGKHLLLAMDTFHLGRLAAWASVAQGRPVKFQKSLVLLDFSEAEIRNMVKRGEIHKSYAEDLVERKRLMEIFVKRGYNIGGVVDNFYSDFIQSVPVTGVFNKFLFQNFQRGAMMEAALHEYGRLRPKYGSLSDAELIGKISRDLNTRFGSLGAQGLFKSRTMQDMARMMFLAPQWNEGLIRSELGTVFKSIPGAIKDSYQERRIIAGSMAKAMAGMVVAQLAANQILNYVTRGHSTFENPEDDWESKISAFVPDGTETSAGYMISPVSLPFETAHLLLNYFHKTGTPQDTVRQYLQSRLSTVSRPIYTAAAKRDMFDRIIAPDKYWATVGMSATPIPISAGALSLYIKDLVGEAVASSKGLEYTGTRQQFGGQYQKQLMATFGLKTASKPDEIARTYQLAQEYNDKNGVPPMPEYAEGEYQKLKGFLKIGNVVDATDEMQRIMKVKTPEQIYLTFKKSPKYPFTRNGQRENDFIQTLKPEQQNDYRAAVAKKEAISLAGREMLAKLSPEPSIPLNFRSGNKEVNFLITPAQKLELDQSIATVMDTATQKIQSSPNWGRLSYEQQKDITASLKRKVDSTMKMKFATENIGNMQRVE